MLRHKALVIGVSAGGMDVLNYMLPQLPENFPAPIIVAQHLHPNQGTYFIEHFNKNCKLNIKRANHNETIRKGFVYFNPPDHHLLINKNKTFSISKSPKINFARPCIDLLFKTAADVFGFMLVGLVLTGANYDGADGLQYIKCNKGLTIVQHPEDAEISSMPEAAIAKTKPDYILPINDVVKKLFEIFKTEDETVNDRKRMHHTSI